MQYNNLTKTLIEQSLPLKPAKWVTQILNIEFQINSTELI